MYLFSLRYMQYFFNISQILNFLPLTTEVFMQSYNDLWKLFVSFH